MNHLHTFVKFGLLVVAAVWAYGMTVSAVKPTTDEQLKTYQKQFLDPQAGGDESPGTGTMPTHMHAHGAAAPPAPALPAGTGGQWSNLPPFPSNFNAIHSIAGPGGKFLLIAGSGNNSKTFAAGTFKTYVWNPATNVRREVPTPEDLFCAGHVLLPDGRALVGGGTTSYAPFKGSKGLYAFNFATERYDKLPSMQAGRWYPSITTAPDGRSIITAGLDENGIGTRVNEVFDYRTNRLARLPDRQFPLYPHLFLAANGSYFYTGGGSGRSTMSAGFWQPNGNTYKKVNGLRRFENRAASASCWFGDVRNQQMLIMGGGWPATNYVDTIKLNAVTPAYKPAPALKANKAYVSCVNLPDGSLIEAHGGTANSITGASREVAILRSLAGPWQSMNSLPAGEHRVYHSMLYLLDDGRLVSMTSNPNSGTADISTSLLVYAPPYLYKGTRPVIKTAPVEVKYGQKYTVAATATNATVKKYAITTPPAPTHSSDPNQRYLQLTVDSTGKITIPTSSSIMPPGWYRLWAVDSSGRISVAHWIHLTR